MIIVGKTLTSQSFIALYSVFEIILLPSIGCHSARMEEQGWDQKPMTLALRFELSEAKLLTEVLKSEWASENQGRADFNTGDCLSSLVPLTGSCGLGTCLSEFVGMLWLPVPGLASRYRCRRYHPYPGCGGITRSAMPMFLLDREFSAGRDLVMLRNRKQKQNKKHMSLGVYRALVSAPYLHESQNLIGRSNLL